MIEKRLAPRPLPTIARSHELLARSTGLIPAHTQTLAKGPGQHVRGVAPVYLERGQGAHVWDVDGNEFIDLNMGIGPLVLGYTYPAVDDAIRSQLERGITFSLMHPLEVEVAELIRDMVPGVERVRFSKTGADVTSAAIRLARAATGRDRVLCCGYHGWHDWYVAVTARHHGIPDAVRELTATFAYNDLESLAEALDYEVAAVILEPVVFEAPAPGFLAGVRRLCDERGVVLIFDEMWTGFRLAPGGAQAAFDVRADLVTFSKAVANGMPLSVLAGRGELMDRLEKDVFFFTTFGGEALSLAAARATLHEIARRDVTGHLAAQGRRLKDGYNAIAAQLGLGWTRCLGPDCRSLITFTPAAGDPLLVKSLLQQEMIRRGVLWGGFHNVSFSHSEADVARVLAAYVEALEVLRDAVGQNRVSDFLRGVPLEPVFRRTGDFHVKPRD